MIGIVIACHGDLADGFASAVSLLAGEPERFATVCLRPGDDPLAFKGLMEGAVGKVDDGDGVLVLVDLFGGTPSNTASQLFSRDDVCAVAGTSLPMVLEAVLSRDQFAIDELPSHLLRVGGDALIDIRHRFVEAAHSGDDEDF